MCFLHLLSSQAFCFKGFCIWISKKLAKSGKESGEGKATCVVCIYVWEIGWDSYEKKL